AGADLSEPQGDIRAEGHALRQVTERVREDLLVQQPVPLPGYAAASFPLRDHPHQTVVGGYVLARVPGDLAELACHPRHVPALGLAPSVQSLASHIGQRTHPRGTGRWIVLRFAPVRSLGFTMPCREHALN